jgi:hypothetical protein
MNQLTPATFFSFGCTRGAAFGCKYAHGYREMYVKNDDDKELYDQLLARIESAEKEGHVSWKSDQNREGQDSYYERISKFYSNLIVSDDYFQSVLSYLKTATDFYDSNSYDTVKAVYKGKLKFIA